MNAVDTNIFLYSVDRHEPAKQRKAQEVLQRLHADPLVLPTEAVLDHALDFAGRFSLSHWDSMVLGACREAGVATLYTEDMGAPRNISGIQLVNPLL